MDSPIAPTASAPAIEAHELRKQFGAVTAVDGIDLAVAPGEIFGLVGPDGAGKTTTMRLLVGILDPTGGSARVAGYDVFRDPEAVKAHIGYMPQRFSQYGELTVAENLYFYANLYRVPNAERLTREQELLAFSRLAPFRDRQAQHLSGGMKQKLALACTLIHTPRVLFLDEPTTGVDPVSRRDFWRILYDLLHQGVTLFVSTPYMDEAERCHRIALIDQGRIVRCDTPAGLRARMRGTLLEIVAEPVRPAHALVAGLPGVLDAHLFGDRLHLWVEDGVAEAAIAAALTDQRITVRSVRPIVPGLEDVFISTLR